MSANFSWVVEEGAWAGRAQVVLVVADCAVLLVTLVLGSAANVFVVCAVRRQKSLQTATNALLVNLALVDLLRCVTDCPLLLLVVLRAWGGADLGLALCSAQLVCFSVSCGAQLLTVAGISLERHRAVTKPFEGGGGGGERRKRVTAWIPFTWAAPALASGLCAQYARDSPVYARCRGRRWSKLHTYDSFGRYVLLPAWCVCLVVIVVCYAHIFIVVRAHGRKIFDKGVFPPPGKKKVEAVKVKEKGSKVDTVNAHEIANTHLVPELNGASDTNSDVLCNRGAPKTTSAPGSTEGQTPIKDSVTLVSELCENAPSPTDTEERGQEPTVTECMSTVPCDTQSLSVTHQNTHELEAPQSVQEHVPELLDVENDKTSPGEAESADKNTTEQSDTEGKETAPGETQSVHENAHEDAQQKVDNDAQQDLQENTAQNLQVSPPQEEEVMGAVCMMPSFANRDKGNKKKESKLAKRSGYIIFTFLIFWLPVMGTIVLNIFLDRKERPGVEVIYELEVLAVCIACMTSLTNPIIYAAVNPQFHNEFYYLKNKCKALCAKQ